MRSLFTLSVFVASALAVNVTTVYQFHYGTWVENVAATRNGSLLVTFVGLPQVYIIHPQTTPATASLIATFPNATAGVGITEFQDDVFAVAVGSITAENTPVRESFSVWKIDLSSECESAKVGKMADIPDITFPNGMAALNPHILLIADSWSGNIAAFDTKTGKTEVVLEDPTLEANFSVPALPIGANGLKLHENFVYYTNFVHALVGRVPIDPSTGRNVGPFEILAPGFSIGAPDDISVAEDGTVYVSAPIAAQQGDTLQRISLNGGVTTIAEGGLVAGTTASAFGRTKKDQDILYLSTMGGYGEDGRPRAGGRVVAVKLE